MSNQNLTAIPFFILAGNIMNQGGIAKRLVDFVMSILGKLPGALLITNIGTNALFGAISGSASAAAAAVGSMIIATALRCGATAVTAATNSAPPAPALLIPPSNALSYVLAIPAAPCGRPVHGRLHPRHHLGAVLLHRGCPAGKASGL